MGNYLERADTESSIPDKAKIITVNCGRLVNLFSLKKSPQNDRSTYTVGLKFRPLSHRVVNQGNATTNNWYTPLTITPVKLPQTFPTSVCVKWTPLTN